MRQKAQPLASSAILSLLSCDSNRCRRDAKFRYVDRLSWHGMAEESWSLGARLHEWVAG